MIAAVDICTLSLSRAKFGNAFMQNYDEKNLHLYVVYSLKET